MLTTEERALSRRELKQLWRTQMRRPGAVRHPMGEAAGFQALQSAVVMVLQDHQGTPHTSGKEGDGHGA